jgi:cytochrome c oxidase assembly protein subunit 11
MTNGDLKQANRRLALRVLAVAGGMFGFGFLLVPLYDVFCEVTGLNGKTAAVAADTAGLQEDPARLVTVELLAYAPGAVADWGFGPAVTRMRVHPGRAYVTHYVARNPGAVERVVRAVPSVSPGQAAAHFAKTECFCFTRQAFAPGEEREMPLRFVIDPSLPERFGTVSLAYTLFEANDGKPGGGD